ncbi:hypothetical protein BUALT_Bualt07G0020600 [Buddleja alternifolia]|uniref:Uncharacterized protein n=1 Tax=Buddleja alternifolia TaxID=168488 RepID=A0AAV6XI87_9LAMI|nr:hypothetical protein BUALT_Bualt07G0020600 [Buddleja alternifolia]
MKKNHNKHKEDDIEILKAVAQAWHSHSSSSKTTSTTSEFDAHRRCSKGKPTRFKLEAMSKKDQCGKSWDFKQSLWDSYEILSVSKKLERGLILENAFPSLDEQGKNNVKRRKESKNSLRSLFNKVSSRRFSYADSPSDED